MKFINHPIAAALMTLLVGSEWFWVAFNLAMNKPGLLAFHLVCAVITTAAAIIYHGARAKAAYYDGCVDGIGQALNPERWRPHV